MLDEFEPCAIDDDAISAAAPVTVASSSSPNAVRQGLTSSTVELNLSRF
jgi:hypothetical protein